MRGRNRAIRLVVAVSMAWAMACGGGGGNGDAGRDAQDASDLPDVAPEIPSDVPEVSPDLSEVASDLPNEEGIAPECSPESMTTDCAAKCTDLGPCRVCTCNVSLNGGTCEIVARPDNIACDDDDPCTPNDKCSAGVCAAGTSICECSVTADCAVLEDGDRCNGTLFCDRQVFPHKCKVDPTTLVQCPTTEDTFCRTSQCDPETGTCDLKPAREGEACLLADQCVLKASCVTGVCASTEAKDCGDGNSCTTDSCDPSLGCIRLPNTEECDDANACTEGDRCANSACRAGTPKVCDDGRFCNGVETCSPETGCMAGTAPDCDDGVPCTDDSCSDELGECVHVKRATAIEGPLGDPRCLNSEDDDCDGTTDAADPECSFGITSVDPFDGPEAGGSVVTLHGGALDLARKVYVDDVDLPFTLESPTAIVVTMPDHAAGYVDVKVEAEVVSYVLADAFRYVSRSQDPSVFALLLGPPGEARISEGGLAPTYEADVTVAGITDIENPEPGALLGQFGHGLRGSLPWEDPSWRWSNAAGSLTGLGSMKFTGTFIVAVGGYLDVAARFSVDGGASWVYADLDGTEGGYDPAQALKLTVFGTPRPGAVVINELMWMGSFSADNDEWVELRNLTPAPYDLTGWVLTGMKYQTGDLVLGAQTQVVTNLQLEPREYYLVAQYVTEKSEVAVVPDVAIVPEGSSALGMLLRNVGPQTYQLKAPDGTVVDEVRFSGFVGFHGSAASGKPVQSMERNAVPGAGTSDSDWHTAFAATGWKGDPRQVNNVGTPRAANSDIPLCATDEECSEAFPAEVLTECEKRSCRSPQARCGIVPVGEGGRCEDGLFCTVGETCTSGSCGNGVAMDCSDLPPLGPCTIDRCNEELDTCEHERDPLAIEGPSGSDSCLNEIDDDCDEATDDLDPQCQLSLTSLSPRAIPSSGGWEMTVTGVGLDIVTGVSLGGQAAASFNLVDAGTITFPAPEQPEPGDKSVSVTDGTVTFELATERVRAYGLASTVLANIQDPTDDIQANLGTPTMFIFGRVDITNVDPPVDPSSISAEIGYGPLDDLESDPWRDLGWTWAPAQYNEVCAGCVDAYEYMSTLQPPAVGSYLVTFRFSVDEGLHYQYAMVGDLSAAVWDPMSALRLAVILPPP